MRISLPALGWSIRAGIKVNAISLISNKSVRRLAPTSLPAPNFILPPGVTGTTGEVVGENRTIPVVNGQFTDNFPNEYTHHVYKIALDPNATPTPTPTATTSEGAQSGGTQRAGSGGGCTLNPGAGRDPRGLEMSSLWVSGSLLACGHE